MRKLIKYLLVLVILGVILSFIGVHFIAPYAILKLQKINLDITPDSYNLVAEDVTIHSYDSTSLVGYHVKSNDTLSRGVMILLHGIGGCKEHFLGVSKQLADIGVATYVLDNRAHGESGGEYITYGYKEKQDISTIINSIKKEYPSLPIGIWGHSMGGAISIQALANDKRLSFGIIESTFTDLSQIVFDYKKRTLGFGVRWMSDYVLKRAGEIAQFNPQEVKPIEEMKKIKQPVFIAHGKADENINFSYSEKLYKALETINKQLVLVEGAGHNNLSEIGGEKYKKQLINFINQNI